MVHVQLRGSEAGFCESKGHLERAQRSWHRNRKRLDEGPSHQPPWWQHLGTGNGGQKDLTWGTCEVPQGRGLVEVSIGNTRRFPSTAGVQHQGESEITSHLSKEHCTRHRQKSYFANPSINRCPHVTCGFSNLRTFTRISSLFWIPSIPPHVNNPHFLLSRIPVSLLPVP